MKFAIFVILSCVPYLAAQPFPYQNRRPRLPEEQPGCAHSMYVYTFYENHAYNLNNTPSRNWICQEPFEELLKLCFTIYKIQSCRKVETEFKIVKNEDTIERGCTGRSMKFWQLRDFDDDTPTRTRVSLDNVPMFFCPLTSMDLKFPKSDMELVIREFYITEGGHPGTVAVLRNSTSEDNICLTKVFRPEEDFVKEKW